MLAIRTVLSLLLVLCFAFAGPARADTRAVYTITDIAVDERSPSVIDAQQKALASARLKGAQRLIEKITLPGDRAQAGGAYIDMAAAEQMIAAVDVQEETRGAGRYRGVLSVVGNPRMVRTWLDERNIPYIDSQAPLALVVPQGNGASDFAWQAAWPECADGALAPYITATQLAFPPFPDWIDLQDAVNAAGAERAILAALQGNEGDYRVALSLVTPAGRQPLGSTGRAPTLADAVSDAEALLADTWKRNSIVRGNSRTLVEANVLYTSITEWGTLRGALARSPLVSDFRTRAIARDGALVSFAYAGDRQRLEQDLRQRGVQLAPDIAGWVLTSALSGER